MKKANLSPAPKQAARPSTKNSKPNSRKPSVSPAKGRASQKKEEEEIIEVPKPKDPAKMF